MNFKSKMKKAFGKKLRQKIIENQVAEKVQNMIRNPDETTFDEDSPAP